MRGLNYDVGDSLLQEWNSFSEIDIVVIKEFIDWNLIGYINTSNICSPLMIANLEDKAITMISSINDKVAYSMTSYSSSKSGLEGLYMDQ